MFEKVLLSMYYKNIRLGKVALDGNDKFFALKIYFYMERVTLLTDQKSDNTFTLYFCLIY